MTLVDVGFAVIVLAMVAATVRILKGPSDADRGAAADVVFFAFIALVVLLGLRLDTSLVIDIVVVATIVGFIAALSLARLITGGKR
ncbi:monovalent cation/H+ antiporter complex subunit F [Cellulomonas bogoriensis]|uniref:Pesticidal protein Cry26Aa n=1 Tax=Cellulomonas bogoriensis 69B4 = DSM 16987 TaxID=1386082 RepID=A0A0A0C124_9CELL|nr:monovalent cation/H+ antiporter complex subunit F [Cellulomonas bogoriensis]KGM13875.1 pesticidal protein Cry26Aa [Cellulomonas bogoriensis 69B4 = DSM 16987]